MANLIKVKRGLRSGIATLAAGEVAFCTDTREMVTGDGTGNFFYPNVVVLTQAQYNALSPPHASTLYLITD